MEREGKTGSGVFIGERKNRSRQGWSCQARIDGVQYDVWLIAIRNDTPQPDTWGAVRRAGVTGRSLWEDRVPASISPREILRRAGLVDES